MTVFAGADAIPIASLTPQRRDHHRLDLVHRPRQRPDFLDNVSHKPLGLLAAASIAGDYNGDGIVNVADYKPAVSFCVSNRECETAYCVGTSCWELYGERSGIFPERQKANCPGGDQKQPGWLGNGAAADTGSAGH